LIWGTETPGRSTTSRRARDNLYTNSAGADINTGKLAAMPVILPNDLWDYDEIGIHMIMTR
jgi:glucose dehydrogenase